MSGLRINSVTFISFVGKNKNNKALWLCKCDCGKEFVTLCESVRQGKTKSCGYCPKNSFYKIGDIGIIVLKDGVKCFIDAEDLEKVINNNWYLHNGYVIGYFNKKCILMHRYIYLIFQQMR